MPTTERSQDRAQPRVSAVICTRERPELVRRAVRSVVGQDYPGSLEVVLVLDDGSAPAEAAAAYADLEELVRSHPGRHLRIEVNGATPGLAGARNTGLRAATGTFVAFCDDDDEWLPGKVSAQLAALAAHPEAVLVATGITIVTHEGSTTRIPPARVTQADLLRSRVAELHPSSFLARRELFARIGPIDEGVPHSYGEDYELLLRCARIGPIVAVPAPLTVVHWDRLSFFNARWDAVAGGLSYLLDRFPEFERDRVGRARVRGQVAFAHAAAGRRTEALRWARDAWRDDPRQLRSYGAAAVAMGLARPERLVAAVNTRGKGL